MNGMLKYLELGVLLPFLCRVKAQDVQNLTVCEGSTANFSHNFDPSGYKRVIFSYSGGGKKADIYKRKYVEEPEYDPHYGFRITETTNLTSKLGFTLQNVKGSDEGKFTCSIFYPNGTIQRFRWMLRVKESKKPIMHVNVSHRDDCMIYTCRNHDGNGTERIYWSSKSGNTTGGEVKVCGNEWEEMNCTIQTDCASNLVVINTNCARMKRSEPDGISKCLRKSNDSPTINDKEAENGPRTLTIVLTIVAILVIICLLSLFCYRKKRLKNKNKKRYQRCVVNA